MYFRQLKFQIPQKSLSPLFVYVIRDTEKKNHGVNVDDFGGRKAFKTKIFSSYLFVRAPKIDLAKLYVYMLNAIDVF